MRFFEFRLRYSDPEVPDKESSGNKVFPQASGINLSTGAEMFKHDGRIYQFNYTDDAPVFDYFTLISISHKGESDWILNDVIAFAGSKYPMIRGYLVSPKFKNLIEKFKISFPFRFYQSKLLYKKHKQDYYIFQMAQNDWENYIFDESEYYYRRGEEKVRIDSKIRQPTDFKKTLRDFHDKKESLIINAHLKEYFDIFYLSGVGVCVSEILKMELENQGITGIEIVPLVSSINFTFKRDPFN